MLPELCSFVEAPGGRLQAMQTRLEVVHITFSMKVMVTQNMVETNLDITNGAQGIIVDIRLNPEAWGATIQSMTTIDTAQIFASVHTCETWNLIAHVPVNWRTWGVHHPCGTGQQAILHHLLHCRGNICNTHLQRHQFPMTAAYVFTDYCSQGQTISSAIMDIAMPLTGVLKLFIWCISWLCIQEV